MTRGDGSGMAGRALKVVVLGLAVAVFCLAPAAAFAVGPSPALLERAARDDALAARLAQFSRRAEARGIDVPAKKGRVVVTDARGVSRVRQQQVASSSGDLNTIALLVDFSDRPHTVAASWFDDLLFADVFGPQSLRGYYREVSYGTPDAKGLLDVVTADLPSTTGWLRLPGTLASYTSGGDNGTGSYPNNAQRMVEMAVAAADPLVDFSTYDNDGDGFVDNLFVIHAGQGAEYTGRSRDIWSHQWTTSYPVLVDGVYVTTYSTEPEYWESPGDMTTGVYAHEMGHVLGLPDLYDRDMSSAGIGDWSLMAGGSWNGADGDSPARLDAWSSSRLGWLQPRTVSGMPAARLLSAVSASRTESAVRLYPSGLTGGPEYFLVENRQQTGTDRALPGSGLLVWHVDEAMIGFDDQNDDETHKLVDLEEAGGTQDLDWGWRGSGSADDPFPGSADARAFDDRTTPNARTYAGAASGVVLAAISDGAASMSARIGVTEPGDIVAPTVQVYGARDRWYYNTDTTLTVAATDEAGGSGVAGISYSLDGRPPRVVAGTSVEVVIPSVPNAKHVLVYRATDSAGNHSADRRFTITMDTVGPVGSGRDASGLRRRLIPLRYRFSDRRSPSIWDVRVVIKRRSGVVARTVRMGASTARVRGRWYTTRWRPKDRGTYRYWVYGRDAAGNPQKVRGYGVIKVR
ncbi:MAG TPA: M6 family metalloprotease domain-containing protein [Thermoleophilia bacterium]|nr:M6 family metalloprotease domain-containing protein [Thermoleophilia bacterium]